MAIESVAKDAEITTHYRACHLCEAICGLKIDVADGRIVAIKGDENDPLSRGHICPKAVALKDLHEDPDRLRQPVRKVSDESGETRWETIDWDEALDRAADGLAASIRDHGVDSVGVYLGNPSVHNYGMLTHQSSLFQYIRTRNRYSATSVDQLPHHLTSLWLYGHKLMFPIPDIDRCDYFLMLGANPLASNGSIWTVPDVKKRIRAMQKRGGKLVLIDPRRSETAQIADAHHFIRPGSDAWFLLAVLKRLFDTGVDARAPEYSQGLDAVRQALADIDTGTAAQRCGISAAEINAIADAFASSGAAICYGRMGVSTQAFGGLCQWLIQLINIVSGNLDAPGGMMFTTPAVDTLAAASPGGFARHRSRCRQLPEFDRELPVSALAEEILTEGEAQIRCLFTGAGNPVLSTPNGRQLDSALQKLDFMVSLDPYINETTCHADVILPPTSALEHDHYDMAFHVNAVRNTARYNPPVFEKPEGSMHDWEIFNALGERLAKRLNIEPAPAQAAPDEMMDLGLKFGPYGAQSEHDLSLSVLKQFPSGVDLGPLQSQLPQRLFTADKMIHCDTAEALADIQRLVEYDDHDAHFPLRLIGRRHVRSNNSWMHNFRRLVKGQDRCTLLMHPDDIAEYGLTAGRHAELVSRVGKVRAVVESDTDMMQGVVSLPHGWGHNNTATRMQIARQNSGVSCNDLVDELAVDSLSGNAILNGVPVAVQIAEDSSDE